MIQYELKHVAV